MQSKPIGIFDSGLGGLTVVKEIMHHLPNESIVYFGDTARVPYGNKSKETVTKFSAQIIRFLKSKNVKAIIIACNTVSSNSIEELRELFPDTLIEGVVNPGAKMALETTKTGHIGVIGTEATIRSEKYPNIIKQSNKDIKVYSMACPLFVPLVEDNWIEHRVAKDVAKEYLKDIINTPIDTLILGCTHYPMLTKVIQEVVGPDIVLVNPALEAAYKIEQKLKQRNELSNKAESNQYEFYVSDHTNQFEKMAQGFLNTKIENVQQIDIDEF